jgi:hypothetical protein
MIDEIQPFPSGQVGIDESLSILRGARIRLEPGQPRPTGDSMWKLSLIAVSLFAILVIAACQTRTQDPVPIVRVNSCGQDCEARRDTCYEECTRNPDNELCEPLCRESLEVCTELCL